MNQEESVYELNRIQRYIMQMRPLLKKNALFSDGTADYRQPVEPDAGDEVTVRFRTAIRYRHYRALYGNGQRPGEPLIIMR